MWRAIRRTLIALAIIQAIGFVAGRFIERRMTLGTVDEDEFRLASIFNGKELKSNAENLKAGTVIAGMGGVDLDLTDAKLDPDGATLDLNAVMGGIRVIVPPEWAIEVNDVSLATGIETNLTPIEDLPEDAPRLQLNLVGRMGGTMVTNDKDASC